MMIAICMGEYSTIQSYAANFLSAPGRLDHGFDMVEVAMQRIAADGGDPIHRARTTIFERFRAGHVARFLELARVRAQVAVADVEQALELRESQLLAHRQRAH